jgi:predicted outer membrane repeat protein
MLSYASSHPTLTNVDFNGNSAVYGGGMYDDTGSSPTLSSVTFRGNRATYGGGIYNGNGSNPALKNVTISGNTAATNGGGAYNNTGSSPTLTNVTFSGNSAGTSGGGLYSDSGSNPSISNSILYGDTGGEIVNNSSAPVVTYSDVQGGYTGTGNISANPKLAALGSNGGFTKTMALGIGSAAIDKGNGATCAAKDQRGVTRPQGGKCDMGAYEVKALTFQSVGAEDGWVLESGETTGVGGTMDPASTTLRLGDDASNQQYRGLLSFNTASLPDGASVVLTRVKVKKQALTGTNPFTTHGKLTLDLKKPFFGAALGLELGDFQAAATKSPAGSIGSALVSGWYSGLLNATSLGSVNKTGTTQLRLRFSLDDNNDHGADYLSLFSGNAPVSSRPVLIVYYNP